MDFAPSPDGGCDVENSSAASASALNHSRADSQDASTVSAASSEQPAVAPGPAPPSREQLLQKLWQRAAGMRSDLIVTFGEDVRYELHRFPLFSKASGLESSIGFGGSGNGRWRGTWLQA